jgi:tetrapyrrole methylase family protein/MazG family protein
MERKPVWIIGYHSTSQQVMDILQAADQIYARGTLVSRWFDEFGIHDLIPVALDAEAFSPEKTVTDILDAYDSGKDIVYATPIAPLAADVVVKNLRKERSDLPLVWAAGENIIDDAKLSQVLDRCGGLTVLDGQELADAYHIQIPSSQAALIYTPGGAAALKSLAKLMKAVYPPEHRLELLVDDPDGNLSWVQRPLVDVSQVVDPVIAVLVPPRSADSTLESFEEVIAHLRAPEGCPWDRKQTHDSLRTYLLEETYETLSALDNGDMEGLKEELGDLLLQILLHAQIGVENGEFNMADVLEGINRKIVHRHPHVFGDIQVADAQGVVQNWEKIKQQEREENGEEEIKGLLDGIPLSFPALAQAQSIQDRAARVGFDWKEIGPVMDKVKEEYQEVQEAPNESERAKELGDLLFAVVNLVRWYKVDAESALRETNLKFRQRFAHIEQRSRETGKPMQEMTLEEMDVFWNEAKKFPKSAH